MSLLITDTDVLATLFWTRIFFRKRDSHTQRFQYQRIEERQTVDLVVGSGIAVTRKMGAKFAAQTSLVLGMVG